MAFHPARCAERLPLAAAIRQSNRTTGETAAGPSRANWRARRQEHRSEGSAQRQPTRYQTLPTNRCRSTSWP